MVLFKRKPVQFVPEPEIEDEGHEVWLIGQTGEIFTSYEEYLDRIDFYKQRRFICQISGHSGLTFFEALKSELEGAAEVEQAFPESLKGPVLRRVQFSTVSRIDTLVDQLYDEFKSNYYPGEPVIVEASDCDRRLHGVVRDKTLFGAKVNPDGSVNPPWARYFVEIKQRPDKEVVVDDNHIWRDRRVFTKAVLRGFIKKTVSREPWNGAPWLVQKDVAEQYHIDTRIPAHLLYDTKLQERRQAQAQKRLSQPDVNGQIPFSGDAMVRLPDLKPAPKSHKSKAYQAMQAQQQQLLAQQQKQQQQQQQQQQQTAMMNGQASFGPYDHIPVPGNPFQFPTSMRNVQVPLPPVYAQSEPPPPPTAPPKYPIDDLLLEPQNFVRPSLKFPCRDPPVPVNPQLDYGDKLLMKSVGPLLEAWDTLNVYCEIFHLDSFTFDDFVQAMQIASDEEPCELFDEIHCAVLKVLVSSEAEGGKIQIQLPELVEEEGEENETEEEQDDSMAASPEPEPQPMARATRGSLAKLEAERLAAEAAAAERELKEAENAPKHKAEELLKDYDWIDKLRKREFQDGGWQMIVVGLLHQLSKNERQKAACEELLQELVPKNVEPTQETVRQHYSSLDFNYRAQALQIMCMLTAETKAVRGYMEDCAETMTAYRKEKIEWQRKRKQAAEELRVMNEERKILLPDNLPPSPTMDLIRANGDIKLSDVESPTVDVTDEVVHAEEDQTGRALRRAQDRAAERKRKAEKQQSRKEKAVAAKPPKQSKQFLKLLKDIQKKEGEIKECEAEIGVIDNDLREADCGRTRVLGKDRYWNRYYWFERNGMPYGGLPTSSTASASYANGCVWVQGPDELEREGYIDMAPSFQDEYKARFNMTVPERRRREEGATSVFNARQWGYYSQPEDIDALINWLDPRGCNEVKLRKEMIAYRDRIAHNMTNRSEYLAARPTSSLKEEDVGDNKKRMSTRIRTAPATAEEPTYRCLAWKNTTAVENFGHLHSEPSPPPAPVARSRKPTAKKREHVPEPEPEVVEPMGKRVRRR